MPLERQEQRVLRFHQQATTTLADQLRQAASRLASGVDMATWRQTNPTPGWKPRSGGRTALQNPRPPAAPASLELNLEEYYAGAALMGILAAQGEEPDDDWLKNRSFHVGEKMAEEARRRRRGRK